MEQKESIKKGISLISLSKKSVIFLVGMLLVLGIMYFTLPFEITVAGTIVAGVIIAYESLRALLIHIITLIVAVARRFVKGIRRAIHVAKMPDEEFEECFSGKSSKADEPQNEESLINSAEEDRKSSEQDNLVTTDDNPTRASLLPEHARILPLTPIQAATMAMDWWITIGLDGIDGKKRLSSLFERLESEAPNEKACNLVEHSDELFLPGGFAVLQAIAELISGHGYEANAEEDTNSLYVIKLGKENEGADSQPESEADGETDGEQPVKYASQCDGNVDDVAANESGELQILLVKPGRPSEMITAPNDEGELERLIESDSVTIYPFNDPVALIHGTQHDMSSAPLNRCVTTTKGDQLMITGSFLIVGWSGEKFASLSEEMADKYLKKFFKTPLFIRNPDQSYSVCY